MIGWHTSTAKGYNVRSNLRGLFMGVQVKSGHCPACGKQQKVERQGRNHILHLLLTIFTFGIWGFVWGMLLVTGEHWRCTECGSKGIKKVH